MKFPGYLNQNPGSSNAESSGLHSADITPLSGHRLWVNDLRNDIPGCSLRSPAKACLRMGYTPRPPLLVIINLIQILLKFSADRGR